MLPGGKGANQAVAASQLGASSAFAGMFGTDAHAAALRAALSGRGVDLALSAEASAGTPSGQAFILLQAGGENSIIIVGGANAAWPGGDECEEAPLSDRLLAGVRSAALVLLQREVPDRVNVAVARAARAAGVPIVLDVGGRAEPLPRALLRLVSVVSPNETELARMLADTDSAAEPPIDAGSMGGGGNDDEALIVARARRLQRTGGVRGAVLVKLGARGSLWVPALEETDEADSSSPVPDSARVLPGAAAIHAQAALTHTARDASSGAPIPLRVVDTTGAGDCFTAAFAVAVLEHQQSQRSAGNSASDSAARGDQAALAQCLRFASAAGALCIQRMGAIPSMPTRAEVDAALAANEVQ